MSSISAGSPLPRLTSCLDSRNSALKPLHKVRIISHHLSQNNPLSKLSGHHALVVEIARNTDEEMDVVLIVTETGLDVWIPASLTLRVEDNEITLKASFFKQTQLGGLPTALAASHRAAVEEDIAKLTKHLRQLQEQVRLLDHIAVIENVIDNLPAPPPITPEQVLGIEPILIVGESYRHQHNQSYPPGTVEGLE